MPHTDMRSLLTVEAEKADVVAQVMERRDAWRDRQHDDHHHERRHWDDGERGREGRGVWGEVRGGEWGVGARPRARPRATTILAQSNHQSERHPNGDHQDSPITENLATPALPQR